MVKSILVENSKAATDEFLDRLGSRVGYPCVVKPNKGTASAGELCSLLSDVTSRSGGIRNCPLFQEFYHFHGAGVKHQPHQHI